MLWVFLSFSAQNLSYFSEIPQFLWVSEVAWLFAVASKADPCFSLRWSWFAVFSVSAGWKATELQTATQLQSRNARFCGGIWQLEIFWLADPVGKWHGYCCYLGNCDFGGKLEEQDLRQSENSCFGLSQFNCKVWPVSSRRILEHSLSVILTASQPP